MLLDESGTLFFVVGNTRIEVAEQFCGLGKALPELLSDAVRYTCGNVTLLGDCSG